MSHGNSQSPDNEDVELSLQLQGLQISVRGSSAASLDFLHRASELRSPLPASVNSSLPASAWSVVTTPQLETRASIEASFPVFPAHLRLLSSSLGQQSSRLSAVERLERAWKAGCWAKAKLQGRVRSPNRTPLIDLGNLAYAVVEARVYQPPRSSRRRALCNSG